MKKNTQLLLGINKPHNFVLVSTLSRLIKGAIYLSRIDESLFKGHSILSASTSRASLSRESIQEILGETRWSSESTWQRFHKKMLVSIEKNFHDRIHCNIASL